jgi:hypothetical protein
VSEPYVRFPLFSDGVGGVIGGDHIDLSDTDALPERCGILAPTQGRVELDQISVTSVVVHVEQQVGDDDFHANPSAFLAELANTL